MIGRTDVRGACLLVILDYYRGAITDRNVFVIDPHLNNYMATSCEWEGGFANVGSYWGTPIVRVGADAGTIVIIIITKSVREGSSINYHNYIDRSACLTVCLVLCQHQH